MIFPFLPFVKGLSLFCDYIISLFCDIVKSFFKLFLKTFGV